MAIYFIDSSALVNGKTSLKSENKSPVELGYSRRFLEEVIGSWESEIIEIPEQIQFEEREEIQWTKSIVIRNILKTVPINFLSL